MSTDGAQQHDGEIVLRSLPLICVQENAQASVHHVSVRQQALGCLVASHGNIPSLLSQVAEKLGVRSLRGQTLAASSDYMQLGVHSVEAFGQSEALTTRLRHIISDYADGPGILMELLQNADDAGATEVAFLLDEESYPTSSILGGPSSVRSYLVQQ